jgi:nitrate/nitrite transport system substrate-binding protein
MSDRTRRFGAGHTRGICSCGAHHSAADLGFVADPVASSQEQALAKSVENSLLVGLFPEAGSRRRFLQTLGSGTALAAIGSFLPVGALTAMAQEKVKPEKEAITIGFLPLTCATPLIMAEEMGLYAKNGLKVTLAKQTSVTIIRDKLLNGELDASEQVMAVPISVTMGIGGSVADPTSVLSVCNVHGNCLVLGMQHKDNQDPKNWKGFAFGVPFEHSVQAMMLRYYVAEHGLDPDKDIKFRTIPSTEYTSQLRAGNLDGFLGGEPHGQLVVAEGGGFIHKLSRDLWTGHPCCTLAARTAWVQKNPNTFLALHRAVVAASVHVSKPENRAGIAKVLAPANYLNMPENLIEQVISGRYADGLGHVVTVQDRILFDPFPYYSMAIWLMTQMKRWGYIKGDVDYNQIAEKVMHATDVNKRYAELGLPAANPYRKEMILGKEFDPTKPNEYLASFAVKAN